jgi:hypothetical protein
MSYQPILLDKSLWKEAKAANYCANPVPNGVYNIAGELVQFHDYEKVFDRFFHVLTNIRFFFLKRMSS